MQLTYRTKLIKNVPSGSEDNVTLYLNEYSKIFQKVLHKLYVDSVHKQTPITVLKKKYQAEYGINARQFNSVRVCLDSIVKSKKELILIELEEKKSKIESYLNKLTKLENDKKTVFEELSLLSMNDIRFKSTLKKYHGIKNSIHYTKRKLKKYTDKVSKLERDVNNKIVRICFGSKELFQKQFKLEENNYKSHEEWLCDWKNARSNQCFFLGSSDESYGNMNCQYDKNNILKIKTASALEERFGDYIIVEDVYFKYGQENIDYCKEFEYRFSPSYNKVKYFNGALNYRFIRNEFGWYLHCSCDVKEPEKITDSRLGGIGIDFNVNFVSVTFVDRFGNPLDELNLKYHMYGKTSNQIDAKLGDLSKELCDLGKYYGVPIYIEDLCFAKAKRNIDKGKRYNRMINGFPYSKFKTYLTQRCKRHGVEIIEVNPSFTSIIGQFKFMKKYGLSSHGAAACMIVRKGMKFKTEKIPKKYKIIVMHNNARGLNNNTDNYKMWSNLSFIIKKNMSFSDRINMLYQN